MQIIYTYHARQRMLQRKITEEQVKQVLDSPDEINHGDGGEEIAVKNFAARSVRVVYKETEDQAIVVYTVIASSLKGQYRREEKRS